MTIVFKIPRVGPRVPWAQGPALIRDPWPKATGPFPGPSRTVRGVWGDPSPQAGPSRTAAEWRCVVFSPERKINKLGLTWWWLCFLLKEK